SAHRAQEPSAPAQPGESQSFALEILDPAGAAVPNAAIEITSQATGRRIQVASDADGHARIVALPPGLYDVLVQAPGLGDEKVLHLRVPESRVTQIQMHTFAMMGEIVQVIEPHPSRLADTLSDPEHTGAGPNSPDVVSLFRRLLAKIRHTL